ncbi:Ragulator complex protein LAMTOR3 [Gilbertella persicaria]|uniref:Ragulator complex protein LAMTOR3 n=1 Tax=Gilbertella persicaria TaxID=101096 RepID=UPI002220B102|nr:Ragulator complex protein LAMTOR3 [Gilbertella persicaria]KAI8065391.1 Ragulator complex protein LAMTOR3 [Gilbertella persicaria]
MESHFDETCQRFFYSGLLVAMVTDRDGVIVLKSSSEKVKDNMTEPIIPTTFAIANNQASKLGLGHNKSIIGVYDQYQIIQLDQAPFVITIIAESNANTGLFRNLGNDLLKLTKPLVESMNE